ncbi:MAG: DUF1801 domain-containing protein [Fimbriimonas sp.]|nr:DUF1801 domain-containing protein [Fimbriimonas sp.]
MLTDEGYRQYQSQCTEEQAANIDAIRNLIMQVCPDVVEVVDEGKWFGGLLTYTMPGGMFMFALGPRSGGFTTFHMMAFYGSAKLRERNEAPLKKFLTGKSCIKFKNYADLPEASIHDIIDASPEFVRIATEMRANRKKKSRNGSAAE